MNGRRKGFTIIELLVVVAIIAVLVALMAPVLVAAKSAAKQTVASQGGRQLWFATNMYLSDHDDSYPPAISVVGAGQWQTWFGLSRQGYEWNGSPDNSGWDLTRGWISPYRGDRPLKDPSHIAVPYLGDMSGYGYNYTYIGGDFQAKSNWRSFPDSVNPAMHTELANPSETIVYTTSSFYYPSWKGGDGQVYDFGFIDPPMYWGVNPNVDFRHQVRRKVDYENQTIEHEGRAVVIFADGNIRALKISQVRPEMFTRDFTDPQG